MRTDALTWASLWRSGKNFMTVNQENRVSLADMRVKALLRGMDAETQTLISELIRALKSYSGPSSSVK